MKNVCFNLIMILWDRDLLKIMSISSKILNFGWFGHSNESKFLLIDWKQISKIFYFTFIKWNFIIFNKNNICIFLHMFIKDVWLTRWPNILELYFVSWLLKNSFWQRLLSLTTISLLLIYDYIIFWLRLHSSIF